MRLKKAFRWLLVGIIAIAAGLFLVGCWLHESRPGGMAGQRAEQMAHDMMQAAGAEAWKTTGAVRFNFAGKHKHVWDRLNKRAAVEWDDCRALLSLETKEGRVWCEGKEVRAVEEIKEHLADAYSYWVNDAFWFAAPFKAFDGGTARRIVQDGEGTQLLVSYGSGGLTPGDAYLWTIGKSGRPSAWNMWVSIIPIGGVRASWEGWIRTETAVWISTRHAIGPLTLRLENVHTASEIASLKGYEHTFDELN